MRLKNFAGQFFQFFKIVDLARIDLVLEFKMKNDTFSMAQVLVSSFKCCTIMDLQSTLN